MRGAFRADFPSEKRWMTIKKSAIVAEFFHSTFVKPKYVEEKTTTTLKDKQT
jgi:hypothetical protein